MEVSGRTRSIIRSWHLTLFIFASHQFLKELDQPPLPRIVRVANRRASHTRTVSSPNLLRTVLLSEAQPLLARRRSFEDQADNDQKSARVAGGTILGIHNLAIVFPQFLVSPFRHPSDFCSDVFKDCNHIEHNL